MRVRVLGSAAGGGFAQWNCRCETCEAARAGERHQSILLEDSAERKEVVRAGVEVAYDGLEVEL